jgi:hypothetical protein
VIGTKLIPPDAIPNHFNVFGELLKGNNRKRLRHLIWLVTTWSILRMRNNTLFRGEFMNVSVLVNRIIYIAWFWFIDRLCSNANVAFLEWSNNPFGCFSSL